MKNILLLLIISLLSWSCYDIGDQLEKINISTYPHFSLPNDSVRANGVDTIQIRVVFPVRPDSTLATVKFTTSEGVFVANNKTEYTSSQIFRDAKTDSLFIYANLRASTKQGKFRVNIEIPKVRMGFVWIKFGPSYPSSITTEKDKFSVTKTYKDEIQLIANLTSTPGLPHLDTPVSFSVVAGTFKFSTGDPLNAGNFRELKKTDSNGRASVYFTPGDLGIFTGPVSFTASAKGVKDTLRTATGTFQIIPQ